MVKKAFTGGDKLTKALAELSKKVKAAKAVEVGWAENATEESGVSSAFIASIHEFGAPRKGIPPRPFFRPMIAKEEPSWGKKTGMLLTHFDYDAEKALTALGEDISGALAQSIIDVTGPALSPVTLLLRQRFGNSPSAITFEDVMKAREDIAAGVMPSASTKPLVWTGDMLNGITSVVK